MRLWINYSSKWIESEKWQTRYIKYVHFKTALKLIMEIPQNCMNMDKTHCHLHMPVVRAFHNETFTNEVRSWFYLVHHSNLLCSFMKLLQIALQPKPNCCWNAFSKMENTEKYNTVIVSQPTLYIVFLNYIVLYFQVFNIVSHWGIDNTEDILWPFLSEYPNNTPHRFINQITLQPFIRSQGIKSVLKTTTCSNAQKS